MATVQGGNSDFDYEAEKLRKKQELLSQLEKSKRDSGQDKHGDFRAM